MVASWLVLGSISGEERGLILFPEQRPVIEPRLVSSTPDLAARDWALAGDIVLCFWARHFTLRAPLFTQVYK